MSFIENVSFIFNYADRERVFSFLTIQNKDSLQVVLFEINYIALIDVRNMIDD